MLLNNWLEYCDLKCGRIDKILWSERDRVGESTQNIKELNEEWKNRMEWNFFFQILLLSITITMKDIGLQ